ncbi:MULTISPECIES: hypothetical protein [Amycolatopsis]|uniref:Uncharacterized protein n=1 Tax=Amycolatopsis rubida TaxID=112413 RepID=A0A1I5J8E1_9PSEU|nr:MULTISPECIES: hypothetical protein [Amycolatopsis]OAP28633.1 hypothetical protein A4R44_00424 [Amycolatopsis sp. M39]SFO69027.1 hypothetical protein SAMN05421854_102995 [Amycolatopsis rubida]
MVAIKRYCAALRAGTDLRDGITDRRAAALGPTPVSTRGLVAA